MNNLVPAFFLK